MDLLVFFRLSVRCSKSKRKSPLLLSQLTLTCSHTETQILEKLQLLPRSVNNKELHVKKVLLLLTKPTRIICLPVNPVFIV